MEYVLSYSNLSHLTANHKEDAGCLCCVAKYTQLSLYSSSWYMLVPLGLSLDWTEDITSIICLKYSKEREKETLQTSVCPTLVCLMYCDSVQIEILHTEVGTVIFFVFNKKNWHNNFQVSRFKTYILNLQ